MIPYLLLWEHITCQDFQMAQTMTVKLNIILSEYGTYIKCNKHDMITLHTVSYVVQMK